METQSYACFAYAAKREDKLTALCLQLPCISLSEGAIHPSTWMQTGLTADSNIGHWPQLLVNGTLAEHSWYRFDADLGFL